MTYLNGLACCGTKELASIQCCLSDKPTRGDAKKMLLVLAKEWLLWPVRRARREKRYVAEFHSCPVWQPNAGLVIFTDAHDRPVKYGDMLAEFIREEKLGEVQKTPGFTNPNTDNILETFFWIVPPNFEEWCRSNWPLKEIRPCWGTSFPPYVVSRLCWQETPPEGFSLGLIAEHLCWRPDVLNLPR